MLSISKLAFKKLGIICTIVWSTRYYYGLRFPPENLRRMRYRYSWLVGCVFTSKCLVGNKKLSDSFLENVFFSEAILITIIFSHYTTGFPLFSTVLSDNQYYGSFRRHYRWVISVYQGATIRREEVTGDIYIARVIHGGLADRSGEIKLFTAVCETAGECIWLKTRTKQIFSGVISDLCFRTPSSWWSYSGG